MCVVNIWYILFYCFFMEKGFKFLVIYVSYINVNMLFIVIYLVYVIDIKVIL